MPLLTSCSDLLLTMPVTFEQFDITIPNLVSRFGTNPEFSQILKFFSDFSEIQNDGWQQSVLKAKMANSSHLG